MKLVTQEHKGECGPACIAMVLGLTLDEAIERAERLLEGVKVRDYGMCDDEMVELLKLNGFEHARSSTSWDAASNAILTVPSLNYHGLLHYLVYDVQDGYLDPASVDATYHYPEDAPIVGGKKMVQWAAAITWGA
jgi:ABC-type bacteriocin/lantibiotic exporter with double-glycine peptidase domain